jgi:hypothetical protein
MLSASTPHNTSEAVLSSVLDSEMEYGGYLTFRARDIRGVFISPVVMSSARDQVMA